ncbi:NAD-P-binding protein [Mycena amicta]|nr:NAD-P-binding protein [Mycena amicta]
MPSLAAIQASNAVWSPSYSPVAVIVGGTSGIGQGVAEAFARHSKGNAHIVIVGRNRSAAESIIASFPKPTVVGVTHEFLACDLSVLADVKRVSKDLLARYANRVNFLFLTTGTVFTAVRDGLTDEGILPVMGPILYGRWAFVNELLPGLRAALAAGEDARVMTVYNAGMGVPIDLGDLGLRKAFMEQKESVMSMRGHISTYHDLMVEAFAARDPEITFIHQHPGLVNTDLFKNSPSLSVRLARFVVLPLLLVFGGNNFKSTTHCGENLFYAMRAAPAGASRFGQDADNLGIGVLTGKGDKMYAGTERMRIALWDHTESIVASVKI